jgi:peptidyl-prolyl cis-trans isomerase D
MATISKIRKHSGWVIGAIGIAMLGFLISDVFTSGKFGLNSHGPKGIGMVYGEELEPKEFQSKYETALNNYRSQLPPEQSISPLQESQVNDQIWNQYVSETILQKELDKLGINVTGEEVMDLVIGPQIHPIALQYLTLDRKTGKYDKDQLYKFITNLDKAKPEQQKFWNEFEAYLCTERNKEKYNGLVKNAMFVTDLEAKDAFLNQNKTATIQYFPLFTSSIADKEVDVSDKDIQDYIDKHKDQYKQEEARSIEYVSFDVTSTNKDSASAKAWIDEQAKAFKMAKNDSSFVSHRGTYPAGWQHRGNFPPAMEDQIFSADSGTILGPNYENGKYQIFKVSKTKNDSVYVYKASHILIRPGGPTEADSAAAEKKARDIYNEIKKGADFSKMAAEKSMDPGNASKGGDLGWFPAAQMVPRFGRAVKKGKLGDLMVVRTEFGTHVIKITANPSNRAVKVAMLERKIQASSETERAAYTAASNFRSKIQGPDDFDKQVTKAGLTKRLAKDVKHNDKTLPGLETPKELVRWMYDNEKGSISVPIPIGNKYVVAYLGRIQKEGMASVDDVRDAVTPIVRNEKKKDKLMAKMKDALEKNKTLEATAKALGGGINSADNISFANVPIPNLASEPAVIGYINGIKPNKVSPPIKSETGVFIVEVKSSNGIKAPGSFTQERQQAMKQDQGRAPNEALNALREAADLKDFRYLYF